MAPVQQYSPASVAIMATEARDATLVTELLQSSGFNAENLHVSDVQHPPDRPPYAIVVCHRHRSACNKDIIPESVVPQRLIVLSDCTTERNVVNFLNDGARHVFSLHESTTLLQARLEAALRQHHGYGKNSFSVDNVHFDIQKRKVTIAGETVELSPKEFEFASRVFINFNKVVKNSELMTLVWSLPQHMDTRRIDTAACRVRKKLKLSSERGWVLKRIRCVGYRLSRVSPVPPEQHIVK